MSVNFVTASSHSSRNAPCSVTTPPAVPHPAPKTTRAPRHTTLKPPRPTKDGTAHPLFAASGNTPPPPPPPTRSPAQGKTTRSGLRTPRPPPPISRACLPSAGETPSRAISELDSFQPWTKASKRPRPVLATHSRAILAKAASWIGFSGPTANRRIRKNHRVTGTTISRGITRKPIISWCRSGSVRYAA
jgi:hypothetical protein